MNKKKKAKAQEQEVAVLLYTNKAPDAPAESLFRLFYEGVLTNTVGVMRASKVDTDEDVLLLVGVSAREDGTSDVFPLARILTHEDAFAYKSPDGRGGWFLPNPVEATEPEVTE